MGAEGNMKIFVDSLQGEAMLPAYATLRMLTCIPNLLRPLLSWILRVVLGDHRKSSLLMWVPKRSTVQRVRVFVPYDASCAILSRIGRVLMLTVSMSFQSIGTLFCEPCALTCVGNRVARI